MWAVSVTPRQVMFTVCGQCPSLHAEGLSAVPTFTLIDNADDDYQSKHVATFIIDNKISSVLTQLTVRILTSYSVRCIETARLMLVYKPAVISDWVC